MRETDGPAAVARGGAREAVAAARPDPHITRGNAEPASRRRSNYPPSIELATLYERVSARGTRYLLGRLGAARIVILPADATPDGVQTWRLLVQERADDRAALTPSAARQRRRPSPSPRVVRAGAAPAIDDPLGDLWSDHGP
jgi:hypothetical protein